QERQREGIHFLDDLRGDSRRIRRHRHRPLAVASIGVKQVNGHHDRRESLVNLVTKPNDPVEGEEDNSDRAAYSNAPLLIQPSSKAKSVAAKVVRPEEVEGSDFFESAVGKWPLQRRAERALGCPPGQGTSQRIFVASRISRPR